MKSISELKNDALSSLNEKWGISIDNKLGWIIMEQI